MLKPLHKIYLLLFFLALLFAGLVTLAIFRYITPYQFSTVKGIQRSKPIFFKFDFYDLDKNGVEERLEFGNNTRGNRYFVKVNRDYRRGLIDQFNFQAPIIDDGFSRGYYDLNGDGVDEVFVFSNDNDYLYLSVIDIQQIKFLVKEKPILTSSPQRAQQEWDISYLYPKFSDLDGDGKPELLFNVNSGYARLPRCLCVLNLQTMEVVKRFDHHMGAVNFEVMDLDQDGKKEIALGCSATNNFSNQPDVFLSDAYSWLVLLDYRLNLLRKPFRIGEKFSGVSVYPVPAKPKPFFLAPTILNKDFRLYVINSQGEISQKDTQHLSLTTGYYIYYQNSLPFIVCSTKDKLLIEYDHHLNITRKFDLPEKILANVLTVEDVLGDGKNEYFLKNVKGIYLLDDEGNTLAFYPTDFDLKRTQFHLVHSPGSRIPQVVLTPPSEVIELSLESSPLYGKLTLIFPGLLVIFYLLLMLGHLSLNKLHQYISFFLFSLRSSDNAIILLNHNGKVLSVNQKVNQFLGLQEPVKQREHFAESLQHRPMVVEAIEECRQNGQQVQRRFSFEDARKSFIGEITVTPFRAFLGHVSAYLVEIKDSTREVLMERQQNWQRNVRKLVHDIKTPLAGVQLKLQSLFMKISENQHLMDEEILKGLEAAHDELLRIRNISKDFLKFSDLQQIQPRALNPQKFLEQCITPFKLYSNEKLKINLRISPELPEEVYWDERQIELLLHIIVENSLDALKGRGMIEVEAKPVSGANQSVASFVEIRISDNGPGIPPEHQGKIFEPHFTTKKEGTGLGLTFAKQIVLQHGGQIEFFSVPSSGTVFVLTIPVAIKESSTG